MKIYSKQAAYQLPVLVRILIIDLYSLNRFVITLMLAENLFVADPVVLLQQVGIKVKQDIPYTYNDCGRPNMQQ